jgi:hypothetical protein
MLGFTAEKVDPGVFFDDLGAGCASHPRDYAAVIQPLGQANLPKNQTAPRFRPTKTQIGIQLIQLHFTRPSLASVIGLTHHLTFLEIPCPT